MSDVTAVGGGHPTPRAERARVFRSGAVAGAASALVFVVLHHIFISDIWATLIPALLAGALCGVCMAWSYVRLFRPASLRTWVGYNLLYVVLFLVLGVASLLVFEPVTTVAALMESSGAPTELFGQAMPLSVAFVVVVTALMQWKWGRNLMDAVAVLVTCTVLTILLGLNISVLGLVFLSQSAVGLVVEFFALVVALNVAFLWLFHVLERRRLFGPNQEGAFRAGGVSE